METVIEWSENCEIEKKLKLTSHLSANNMYVFNEKQQIVKMESPEEIIYHFWRIRNEYYLKRKEYLVNKLKYDLDIITNKIRFVNDIMNDKIIVFKKKLIDIRAQLNKNGYKLINESYDYLTDMKIHTFSEDTLEILTSKCKNTEKEYSKVSNMTTRDFWLEDIN